LQLNILVEDEGWPSTTEEVRRGGHTGSEKEWRTRTDESRGVKAFVKETAVHLSQ